MDRPLAELAAAVQGNPKPDRALLERAAAGRDAIRFAGADPVLTLALVVWPPEELTAALTATGREQRLVPSGHLAERTVGA